MHKHLPLLLLLLCFASSNQLSAQVQLTDFNYPEGDKGSNPAAFVRFNGLLFFQAYTNTEGREIWVSDGTTANTRLLKDINPGASSGISSFSSAVVLGDLLYFIANDGENGHQLWATKGTAQSTRRITSIAGLSANARLTLVGDQLFFTIRHDRLLAVWKSDGTQEGTQVVKDGLSIMNTPSFEGSANNLFFFTFQPDGSNNSRVWRSDGSEAGTFPLTGEIDGNGAGPSGTSELTQYIEFNNELYFVARSSQLFPFYENTGIIKTDGSLEGTLPVKGLHDGYSRLIDVADVIEVNQKLYFSFFEAAYNRIFIWESDGTASGTKNIYDESGDQYYMPSNLSTDGSNLLFTGKGTDNMTSLLSLSTDNYELTEINQLFSYTVKAPFYRPSNSIHRLSDKLYHIFVETLGNEKDHWITDLSEANTRQIDLLKHREKLFFYKDHIYFDALATQHGKELWRADQAFSGSELFLNINESKYGLEIFSSFASLDEKILFSALTPEIGQELWAYHKATDEVSLVKDIRQGEASSYPYDLIRFKDHIYFRANTEERGTMLYKSDGTESGTITVSDAIEGPEQSNSISHIAATKELLFFVSRLKNSHYGLNSTNGTDTWLIKDLGLNGYDWPLEVSALVTVGNQVYFSTYGAGGDLWISDGTEAGTFKLRDFYQISQLTAVQGKAYFVASETNGEVAELWQSNATPSGTTRVSNSSGEDFSRPANLTAFNGQLVFSAYTAAHGTELWKTDGTAAGTEQIADIRPGPAGAIQSSEFALIDGILFFRANDGSNGLELWKTDGTGSGTAMVMDIRPGELGAQPKNLFSKGDVLYFSAYTPESGYELWASQGTASTTRQTFELSEGPQGSEPSNFMLLDNELFFTAETTYAGRQLWRADSKNLTAIAPLSNGDRLNVYPNPTADHLYLDSEGRSIKSLQLFTINGQLIPLQGQSSNSLHVAHLPPGLYILMIESEGKTFIRKFIKK